MKQSQRSTKKALLREARVNHASAGDTFQNVAARLGYGAGNLTDASNYNIDYLSRNRVRLDAMYRSSWICGKAVDCVAEDMCKRGIELQSDMDPSDEAALEHLWKQLKIWDRLSDTIKWARLYGGAIAVMLIDGQKLDTPLNVASIGKDQFKGLCALDRWMAIPDLSRLVTDYGPDLGRPLFYDVIGGGMMPLSGRIHYSRVIRLEGQELPHFQRIAEMLWGQSVLERLWDRVLAFDSTTQGAAQLVYKAHLRTIKIKDLRQLIAMGGQAEENLLKQIDFIRRTQSNEGLTVLDAEDEFDAHQYSFGGLDALLLQFGQQLSGSMSIPLTRLFGQSPAGLNSTGEGDLRTYYDGINQEQEAKLRSGIQVLLEVTHLSRFGKPIPNDLLFSFRPLWLPTETEKAAIAGQVTTAVTSASTSGLIGQKTALKELKQSSKLTGVWTNIDDSTIEAASDDANPLGELGGGSAPLGEDENRRTTDEEWREADHPRKEDGEFTSGGGETGPHGPIFREYSGKPAEAIQKLLREKTGEVPGAWTHPQLGSIDLVWGSKQGGLQHIFEKHVLQQGDLNLEDLAEMIPTMPLAHSDGRTAQLESRSHRAAVRLDYDGAKKRWLVSAYERTR